MILYPIRWRAEVETPCRLQNLPESKWFGPTSPRPLDRRRMQWKRTFYNGLWLAFEWRWR
ncbi:hypothetical protein IEQ34_005226 [Dendrobium chrysotoxum]|uniref:Uncharacterized protein n=1 Tax=Dendrobium chrysotoxum TaxID=161865 RepID=A0AAV7HCE4_DENCH|nr:hypothetical protein IEQ34_005226 [Dendrobium chrysotoxum]